MNRIFFLILVVAITPVCNAKGVYQEPAEFIKEVFRGETPKPSALWITQKLKPHVKEIMGRDLDSLRVRYWGREQSTAWILEEIGKEKPITVGIVVNQGKIEQLKVLVFRETRGNEVRYPFFTDQFKGRVINEDKQLDKSIDGISGATLSVRALRKLSRLALYLHKHSKFTKGAS